MFRFSLRIDANRILRAAGFALLAVLTLAWMAFDFSRQEASSRLVDCEPRGRAGEQCRPIDAAEARPLSTCESHGRGGRICYALQE